jgi:hypothetical protein
VHDRGRLIEAAGIVSDRDGAVLAEASGTFMRLNPAAEAEIKRRYGVPLAPARPGTLTP